jgi:transcriptional regulator GlxA family with amidase domain
LPGGVAAPKRRPLEPYFLKRADRFVEANHGEPLSVADIAAHVNVSCRTLEKAFAEFRGLTAVAHLRNRRLDDARIALETEGAKVAEVAERFGFRSVDHLCAGISESASACRPVGNARA